MGNRSFWYDPMAKIEDEWFARKGFKHRVNGTIERAAASHQAKRVKIALYGNPALDVVAGKIAINHPIKADRVDGDLLCITQNRRSSTARKPDDFGARDAASHDFNNSPCGL